jgi:acyl-CoA synthetase (NDP forming)
MAYNIPAWPAQSKGAGLGRSGTDDTVIVADQRLARWDRVRWQSNRTNRPAHCNARAEPQLRAINRARNGLSTYSAKPTTTKFMIAVTANTICQEPVEALITLASGTRKADVPFAV